MFCTTCELYVDALEHYSTQLHAINARRRLVGYPPLSAEELESDSQEGGLIIDLYHNYDSSSADEASSSDADASEMARSRCLFCAEPESVAHYALHGLASGQAAHIMERRCHVCYEKFGTREQLLRHITQVEHRTAETDGISLYLRNGRVLHPRRTAMNRAAAGQGPLLLFRPLQRRISRRFLRKRRLALGWVARVMMVARRRAQ